MTSETDRINIPVPYAVPAMSLARYVVRVINNRLKLPLTPDFCESLAEHLSTGAIHPRIIDDLMDSIANEVESASERHVEEYRREAKWDEEADLALHSPPPDWHN